MDFKVTSEILDLANQLLQEGYKGTIELTNSYASGTATLLKGHMVLSLTGFCKETLYLAAHADGTYVALGRYRMLHVCKDPYTVEDIVQMAWDMYQKYKNTAPYTIQSEWLDLYIKYGYVKEKITTVYEELK